MDADAAGGFVGLGHAGAGLHEDIQDGKVGLEAPGVQPGDFHLAENGAGGEEGSGTGPVGLDGEGGRLVALAAPDPEIHARAQAPVLRFQEIFPAFHLGTDPDAEFLQHVHGNEQIRDTPGLMHVQGRFFRAERQGGEQAGKELGAAFSGNVGPSGDERTGNGERQVTVLFPGIANYFVTSNFGRFFASNTIVTFGVQTDAVCRHDVVRAAERPVQEGFLPRNPEGRCAEHAHQRNAQARQEAGFAGMELGKGGKTARLRSYTFNNQRITVNFYLCTQRPGNGNGAFTVAARRVGRQGGRPLRERRRDDGPLGKALGGRHSQIMRMHKTERTVNRLAEGGDGHLTGSRSFLFRQTGISERRTLPKRFYARRASGLTHAEGHKGSRGLAFVQCADGGIIGL